MIVRLLKKRADASTLSASARDAFAASSAGAISSGRVSRRIESSTPRARAGVFQRLQLRQPAHVGVGKRRDAMDSRHRLHENFLAFAVKLGGENGDARGVAVGLGKRVHESLPNHVVGGGEDRNLARCPLRGANGRVSAGQDDIDLGFHQLGRMFPELLDA